MVTKVLFVRLEAKPGKETEVADFLRHGLPLAVGELSTIAWFAVQFSPSVFGIFDAFPDEDGRQSHLSGPIAEELIARAPELLAVPPSIEYADILAAKLPPIPIQ